MMKQTINRVTKRAKNVDGNESGRYYELERGARYANMSNWRRKPYDPDCKITRKSKHKVKI